MNQLDFILVNSGDTGMAYQDLKDLCALEPPTFTALVANYLLSKGFSGEIVDTPTLDASIQQIAENIVKSNPILVGVYVYGYQPSASTQNMTSARLLCQAIRDINPSLPILISGTHPAALPRQTLIEEPVTYVCDREGFETMEKLILHHRDGSVSLNDIPSLWYHSSVSFNGRLDLLSKDNIVSNLPSTLMSEENMNSLIARPAWQLLDMTKYRSHNWHAFETMNRTPYASMYTSLGCPFKCSFCCINAPFGKASYRLWHPDTIIKQIDELVNVYGIRNIKFVDEMFVLNEDHVMGICDRIIDRGYDLNIWAYARIDTVKDHFLQKLRQAGFRWLALGIESGSKHVRDGASKRYGNDDIIEVVRKIQNHGIYIIGNYIFGLPDDTFESMNQTLDMAIDLNCEFSNFYSAMAYPGSRLYQTAIQNNWQLPMSWSDYSQHGYGTFPLATDYLSNKEVLKFRDEAFVKYFSGSKYKEMIRSKFGDAALDGVDRMLSVKIKRRLYS